MTKKYFAAFLLLISISSFSQVEDEQEIILNKSNSNEKVYSNYSVDRQAKFKNDERDLYKFYAENSKFKTSSIKMPERSVYFNLYINEKGEVYDFKIIKSLNCKYDTEVERLIKLMPAWTPAMNNGQKVKVSLVDYITFQE